MLRLKAFNPPMYIKVNIQTYNYMYVLNVLVIYLLLTLQSVYPQH